MKQSLSIGLTEQEPGWQRLLEQEGLHFSKENLSKVPHKEKFAAIILNSHLNKRQLQNLESFVKQGGAVLSTPTHTRQLLPKLEFALEKMRPVHPKGKFFHGAGLLWLNQPVSVFPRLEAGQPLELRVGKGLLIALPFDPNKALLEQEFENRAFFSKKAFPNEFSSKASKACARSFVRNCLIEAFEHRNIPFVQLWYYPKRYSSVFCFHVDLDFLDQDTTQAISLFKELGIEPTWFLNIDAIREPETKPFVKQVLKQSFVGQHGFKHDYKFDDKEAEQNTLLGHKSLEKLEIESNSFSAPNGVWNQGIAKALEELSYKIAIAFSLDNDNLPFNPLVNGKNSKALFVPTHPVCIGLLKQYDFSEKDLIEYFLDVVERNKNANLPIMLYSHPFKEIARFPAVIERIVQTVKQEQDIWLANHFEFADWWVKRQKSLFSIQFNGRQLSLKATCPQDASFRLVKNGKQFFFPATETKVDIAKLENGSQVFSGFLQDTVKKPSPKGRVHLAKQAAGQVINLFKR